ncbi:MAG: hypothetical protein IMZ55_02415 [Acidobacteria bacterium]|nr:hypothetical protein [Acidobacteriota bacterium]
MGEAEEKLKAESGKLNSQISNLISQILIPMLQKLDGPECPRCGCADARLVRVERRWGKRSEILRCQHCGETFTPIEPQEDPRPATPAIGYYKVICPKCASPKFQVMSTRQIGNSTVRFHRCEVCGTTGKSTVARKAE